MKFGGLITYSRTAFEVEAAARELLKTFEAKKTEVGQAALGFDIEWRPTFKRGQLISLEAFFFSNMTYRMHTYCLEPFCYVIRIKLN